MQMAAGRVVGEARTTSPLGRVNIAKGWRPARVYAGKNVDSVCASRGHCSLAATRAALASSAARSRSSSSFSSSFFVFSVECRTL